MVFHYESVHTNCVQVDACEANCQDWIIRENNPIELGYIIRNLRHVLDEYFEALLRPGEVGEDKDVQDELSFGIRLQLFQNLILHLFVLEKVAAEVGILQRKLEELLILVPYREDHDLWVKQVLIILFDHAMVTSNHILAIEQQALYEVLAAEQSETGNGTNLGQV